MTPKQAMNFVRYHGVVLEAAAGLEPSLAQRIAGEPVRGSWWSHPKGREIYNLTQRLRSSTAILVCGLAAGKVTYVHRRLWPPFIRVADSLPSHALDQIREVHTQSGRHRRYDVPFPEWVPGDVMAAAESLSIREAESAVSCWLERYGP